MSLAIREKAKGKETRDQLLKLVKPPKYEDGMTKQSFKDQTDINKLLSKHQTAGSLAHLMKYPEATYGEFDGEFSLLDAQQRIQKANEIFDDLPSEVRREFGNNALSFVQFAGDPANNDKLRDLLPALAKPGSYFPNPVQRGGVGAGAATAPTGEAPANAGGGQPANPPPAGDGDTPAGGDPS